MEFSKTFVEPRNLENENDKYISGTDRRLNQVLIDVCFKVKINEIVLISENTRLGQKWKKKG